MSTPTDDVRRVFVRELRAFVREIEMFPDDDSVWRVLPGVANSAGNLASHVCGNLKHFVGAVLGGTGYVRDRDGEFARRTGTRADLVRELAEAEAVVSPVLPGLTENTLAAPYPEAVGGVVLPCNRFLLHLATHLAHHLGQAGYLRRALTGDSRGSGAIAIRELAG